ncbi:hypothetical protein A3A60_03405 [Candidatus Curtissbacteria bacterium RIFCSPLOWO2_01_FULL_42_26]|uniref:DUF4012 domain-containing protein n=1 Tax=Candidatus Curtissbacteria bacterium RIFCSPLOWO2_01_FULL_42_26 TaxID=1797729 RepID=A0A1F5I4D8_9BACT|nr:MAG: hypothetical protein A3A60_03405 [Candidatus Curtissbacteria bacterium RIFCSPLOWO2_01_FULL_42_26]
MNPPKRRKIKFYILLLIIFVSFFALLSGLFLIKATFNLRKVSASAKSQDLAAAKTSINAAQNDFKNAKSALSVFTPFRIIPFFGWYIADIQRGVSAATASLGAAENIVDAIAPYADVLGFKEQGNFLGGSAAERLNLAIETLSKITPQLDKISANLTVARKQIDQIQSWRYPNFLPTRPRTKIETAKETIDRLDTFIVQARPLIEVLPQIMGRDGKKKYLILFQNNAEIRPTGGFITAYAYLTIDKGKIESAGSSDIYKLDETLTKKFPAPAPILKYLPNVYNLNIRDTNLSPDFLISMKQFENLYKVSAADQDIEGIITVDTNFVLNMIKVLGPIEVEGTKYTADIVDECACPQIIYQLEKFADEPVNFEKGNERKAIISPLMQQMITMILSAPQSKWPHIISTILSSFSQKHILLYFKEAAAQNAVEKVNFAGRVYNYEDDYFYLNETNFGGAKSNLYIKQTLKQIITKTKNGQINKKITIEYKYPRRADNCSLERKGGLCLAGIYRDWIRIYVPLGSTLIKSSGLEQNFTTGEDLGKTLFEGFFTLRPEGIAKIEIEYTSPVKLDPNYKLLIQKQPGVPNFSYDIEAFGKKIKAFPLDSDKELIVKP